MTRVAVGSRCLCAAPPYASANLEFPASASRFPSFCTCKCLGAQKPKARPCEGNQYPKRTSTRRTECTCWRHDQPITSPSKALSKGPPPDAGAGLVGSMRETNPRRLCGAGQTGGLPERHVSSSLLPSTPLSGWDCLSSLLESWV